MTTPPGQPPDPSRPSGWGDGPPAGSSGSGQQYPAQPYPGQPYTGQQPPGGQYPAQPYPAQQYPGGQGQYPQAGGPQGYPQQDPYGQYGQPQKSNGLGIAALVLGILSLPAAFFAGVPGIVLGLLAIVLGVLGLRRVRARRADNRGVAISGLVTGILGLLLGIVVLVATVFLVQTTGDCLQELQQTGDQAAYEQCVQESVGQ
ncbi:DUF4190 domain-containing protein [Geodermatophilus sp. DSM 44513]|uniref:DUF4190 domain-containing protein n=1 Tax=Geodermatophilus sp. DSM 44513 TaxID=1528104 RepID=UPI0012717497|nr:DUF4190 domain-containing protein [Geodermatophilus sp. DSM 44513]WNV75347.1 DUF4190 domain-containing protein [Geodermatophilus sp. DSM 44513]